MANSKRVKIEEQKKDKISTFSPKVIALIAEEIAKRLPGRQNSTKKKKKKNKKLENPIFLDTSAIIDGRIFEIINLKVFYGTFVVLESILLELKHIADSQDMVKKERGRRGLDLLEKLKKAKGIKTVILSDIHEKNLELDKIREVDEKLIKVSKLNKAKIITCDYNLEKKATISGVAAINVNTLANVLKVRAIPGESFEIKLLHKGKDLTQGIGYLDDGTMVVVENSSAEVGRIVDIVVSRVIQTTAGRILFAKKIR
ncbi:MAG: hypothetical protein COX78_02840 [Candidatus Levybacteria bacterium CG_4_10_14_0_2_um_filter_35_8]|nr:MAG: hypothetical protein COY68_00255 [Candidatus Levybacteria bacterium CG_4_10_14_0_8_um_filter_35_23]PIZ98746.1 MAG: hypothetical protein COX78_02840 [Candidatus Levybacteria bacterium CG_4_10_14_0_2_um_filter_35_8]